MSKKQTDTDVTKIIARMDEGGDLSLDAMRRLSRGQMTPVEGVAIARVGGANVGHAKAHLAALTFQRRLNEAA